MRVIKPYFIPLECYICHDIIPGYIYVHDRTSSIVCKKCYDDGVENR